MAEGGSQPTCSPVTCWACIIPGMRSPRAQTFGSLDSIDFCLETPDTIPHTLATQTAEEDNNNNTNTNTNTKPSTTIHHLPDLCLLHILHRVGSSDSLPLRTSPSTPASHPLHCALVCKHWRSLVDPSILSLNVGDSQREWLSFPAVAHSLPRWTNLRSLNLNRELVQRNKEELDTMMAALHRLPSLRHLTLSYFGTHISELCASVGSLTALQTLNFTCQDVPPSAASAGRFPEVLRDLALYGCGESEWSESLGLFTGLRGLRFLRFDSLLFSARTPVALPTSLGGLRQLTSLEVNNLARLSTLPRTFGQLHGLRVLELLSLDALRALPEDIGELASLEVCRLRKLECLGALPDGVGGWGALTRLEVAECGSLSQLPASLSQLTALRDLTISECPRLAALPEGLATLSALTCLRVLRCELLRGRVPGRVADEAQAGERLMA